MFRGELEDYDGDPFGHLITSSTMFYNPDTGEEINGTWDGGEEKVDVVTYHSYPVFRVLGEWMTVDGKPQYVQRITDDDPVVYALSNFHSRFIPAGASIWAYAANRIHNWSKSVGEGTPKIVTESGFIERPTGGHAPAIYGKKYPTVYHYQLWAALVSGHAAAPFDWNDGKEFGEMKWRDRDGEFSKENYPIDLYAELANVQRFLDGEDISRYTPLPDDTVTATDGLTVWCIADSTQRLLGWAFIDSEEVSVTDELSLTVSGLDPNITYHTQWYNTWTGEKTGDPVSRSTDDNGQLVFVVGEFLAGSVIKPETGPNDFENNPDDWHDDGKDVAFKITRRQ
jgi:hypothetical protein